MSARVVSCALLAAAAVAGGCGKEPVEAPTVMVRPVKSVIVTAGDATRRHTFSGTARADIEADISFKVSGTLKSRPVDVGDAVAAGQVLATLDARDFAIRVNEAEAQLANARAALRNAESSYARVRDLYENDNVSRSELDAARAAAESAAAQVRIAEQSLANNRLQLSYTRVTSPAACDIAETFVKENENVASGQPIVRLNCGACAEVRVSVPETVIRGMEVGEPARASFAALPEQAFAARVSEVGVAMVGDAATFPVVVRLEPPCEQVRPGMAADVTFDLADASDGEFLLVPVVAVGEDRAGRYVYVLEPAGEDRWRAVRRAVETGGPQMGGIRITAGLSPGERIVTAGVRRIGDGQVVRLYEGGT